MSSPYTKRSSEQTNIISFETREARSLLIRSILDIIETATRTIPMTHSHLVMTERIRDISFSRVCLFLFLFLNFVFPFYFFILNIDSNWIQRKIKCYFSTNLHLIENSVKNKQCETRSETIDHRLLFILNLYRKNLSEDTHQA